jgi:hypothetical protein
MTLKVRNCVEVNFLDYQRKIVEVELKEKSLAEKSARESSEYERQKDSIEKERKDLETQR